MLFVASSDGTVRAYDPETGDERWSRAFKNPTDVAVLPWTGPEIVAVVEDGAVPGSMSELVLLGRRAP